MTEGPYWVNTLPHRSGIRSNFGGGGYQAGVPLSSRSTSWTPARVRAMDGVAVDIWHANAHGLYSDETSQQAGRRQRRG